MFFWFHRGSWGRGQDSSLRVLLVQSLVSSKMFFHIFSAIPVWGCLWQSNSGQLAESFYFILSLRLSIMGSGETGSGTSVAALEEDPYTSVELRSSASWDENEVPRFVGCTVVMGFSYERGKLRAICMRHAEATL